MANVLILAILMRDKNAPPQTAPSHSSLFMMDPATCLRDLCIIIKHVQFAVHLLASIRPN